MTVNPGPPEGRPEPRLVAKTPNPGPPTRGERDAKDTALDAARAVDPDGPLTTDQGVRVDDTDNSLAAGERGPTLLEDFQLREKLTHFDHERIPERVVHARGTGAYGFFEPYGSLAEFTCADFLQEGGSRTPVFVRFSTVQGPRGSADTVRDVRGFAVKFYTRHGNYDLVGNNMPVFFIQDAIKFPDFVHAVKMEPHNEIPTGGSAHDTFWDFCSLQPESTHMLMWVMSDRGIPRSYRMMQGFGVHTFRLVNTEGRGTFVKFHWKPRLGTYSQVWDEAQITAGRDPDFHRRDLWEAIEAGDFPEWELGVQLIPEQDEFAYPFDLLDPTKIVPEELVPVRPVGRMVLDRTPENFFAETEQVAFHTANIVPGIDFTNDPLLQGRNFSYLDTQLIRLGGPNFSQLPVNRPLAEVRTNHRDGYGQHTVHSGTSYAPNSVGGGCPFTLGGARLPEGVFEHYQERVDGAAIRRRSPSFADHYSQAALFWRSMADWEQEHITAAFSFELGKVAEQAVRRRMVANLARVDGALAVEVARRIGEPEPSAMADEAGTEELQVSPALSLENQRGTGIHTRKIAVLVADGVDAAQVRAAQARLRAESATAETLALHGGSVVGREAQDVAVARALPTTASVLYDAVVVPDGTDALAADPDAVRFVSEALRHGKPVAVLGSGIALCEAGGGGGGLQDVTGVAVCGSGRQADAAFWDEFVALAGQHRFPSR
ncbi:catalase [Streptomyces sp. CB01881]|uniref:catalase n=1 Tax=Streptomyces sp. CB01881 TaxID=2078691 RepID=UPI000CDC9293|nr:catalase [Streptomyces sp. CB01881]AUY47914.1 catalase HPII [Streptomyces sp. CB01881]TYC76390.1 catalase [Streptomyces sp. CB01881]